MFNATINATISAVENNVAGIGEAQADVARASTSVRRRSSGWLYRALFAASVVPRERMAE
jgi:hypothetical protein